MKSILILTLNCLVIHYCIAQNQNLGIFKKHDDIGDVKLKGSASYNPATEKYKLEGAGTNMWFGVDELHFLWKSMKGDFTMRAQIQFLGEGVDPHRKIGLMLRRNLSPTSPHVNISVHGDGLVALQFRRIDGADTEELRSIDKEPLIIQLERIGNNYIMSTGESDKSFTIVEVKDIDLGNKVLAGLYICSHNPDVREKAVFSKVEIIKSD